MCAREILSEIVCDRVRAIEKVRVFVCVCSERVWGVITESGQSLDCSRQDSKQDLNIDAISCVDGEAQPPFGSSITSHAEGQGRWY